MQKYETAKKHIFSKTNSLDSSICNEVPDMKSCKVRGAIYIIFPILRLYIHSDWFKYPRMFFISASLSFTNIGLLVLLELSYFFNTLESFCYSSVTICLIIDCIIGRILTEVFSRREY
jgi:hypothetical protein